MSKATVHKEIVKEDGLPAWVKWGLFPVMIGGFGWAFFAVSQSQFAAPASFLFNTPTQEVEAAYCMVVAEEIHPNLVPPGSYISEARNFWMERLRKIAGPTMGEALLKARVQLTRDIEQVTKPNPKREWLEFTVSECSHKATSYGMRFREFQ
ncbi:hypothetical protein [Thioclava sp. GXIMD4216]|uniref:Uncharacterized protein n=1 Tax=Thioclava litoralis TaxID=3076557 RepID=A0ABZ1E1D0_9RHOB|nr:hypothetical protein RPE78_00880 [Thioclava sp. FTW29]